MTVTYVHADVCSHTQADDGANTYTQFKGTGTKKSGKFVKLNHECTGGLPDCDAQGYPSSASDQRQAAALGAFAFYRIEVGSVALTLPQCGTVQCACVCDITVCTCDTTVGTNELGHEADRLCPTATVPVVLHDVCWMWSLIMDRTLQ